MTEPQILNMIREVYGSMLVAAAAQFRHRPEVLAGIVARESEGGTSRLLDRPGPEGRGDNGFGHGLMQIDSRSFPEFCAGDDWRDPYKNISKGAEILRNKRRYIASKIVDLHPTEGELEQFAISAYNCGEGRAVQLIQRHQDPDIATAHGNYASEVLRLAESYMIFVDVL